VSENSAHTTEDKYLMVSWIPFCQPEMCLKMF